MGLSLRRTVIGDTDVLIVDGTVDLSTVPQFSDGLNVLVRDARGKSAAVDLDQVLVLDDAALGILLGAAGRAHSDGGELIVVCTNEKLRLRFSLTRFDNAVQVRSTISEI